MPRIRTIVIQRLGKVITQTRTLFTEARRWTRRGFMPNEAYHLQEISANGRQAPYLQFMVKRRIGFISAAKTQKWSAERFQQRIYKDYLDHGMRTRGRFESYAHYFRDVFYDYLNAYKERRDYWKYNPDWEETPRRKRKTSSAKVAKPKRVRQIQRQLDLNAIELKMIQAQRRGDRKEWARLDREAERIRRER